ncbi:hypothetical protein DH2020_001581 [Rehmannia glutinosa]|uniref:Protein PALE CRESS, chloroplastic n=1 Tax=Rehmannia glutinosa TaxID=99300 RepID=A0ABR0XZR9_REHGL
METKTLHLLTCTALPPLANFSPLSPCYKAFPIPSSFKSLCRSKKIEDKDLYGLPKEYYDDKIVESAEKGELNELVLLVIWNRLDLARRDTEILKREATPTMRLLNDLLNMHDGFDDDGWLKACKKHMVETFPREDPFSILVPAGFDIDKHQGPIRPTFESDDVLLRVDFVREVNELLQEVRPEQHEALNTQSLDPEAVASRLKQQEKQRAIRQVEALLDLAINLAW